MDRQTYFEYRELSEDRKLELEGIMQRGNKIRRDLHQRLNDAVATLVVFANRHCFTDLEEFRSRLFLPKTDFRRINPFNLGMSEHEFRVASLFANQPIPSGMVSIRKTTRIVNGDKIHSDKLHFRRMYLTQFISRYREFVALFPKSDTDQVSLVSSVAVEVCSAWANQGHKMSRKFFARCDGMIPLQDIEQVVFMAMFESVCYYSKSLCRFRTYMYTMCKRRLIRFLSLQNDFAGLGSIAHSLIGAYYQTLLSSKFKDKATFEQVVAEIEFRDGDETRPLTDKEVNILRMAMSRFQRAGESFITAENDEDIDPIRAAYVDDSEEIDLFDMESDFDHILKNIDFTPRQLSVLEWVRSGKNEAAWAKANNVSRSAASKNFLLIYNKIIKYRQNSERIA